MPNARIPPGVRLLNLCLPGSPGSRQTLYKWFTLFLTYIVYIAFHMSRRPIAIVKNSEIFFDCSNSSSCSAWMTEMNGEEESTSNTLLGLIDSSYLFSYAAFMFLSGWVAERMDLRYFLSGGMVLSGLCVFFFGLAYSLNIHSIGYFIAIQVVTGIFQSTGWPGVVTVVANWFGKGRRGLIMGIWNSHTCIGNIIGNEIAAVFVEDNWGLSFIVPGIVIAVLGVVMFLFLAPSPAHAGFLDTQEAEKEAESGNVEEKEEAIGFLGALRIPGVLEFALCLFFAKLVSYTFLYWLPNYIHEMDKLGAKEAASIANLFDYGGIAGGILAGLVSDKTGKPAMTCASMMLVTLPCLLMYQALVKDWCPMAAVDGSPVISSCYYWNFFATMGMGFLVTGPYSLITTAVSAELGQHPSLAGSSQALATVTAIIDGTGSIGAAIGPLLAGPLTANDSWDNVFYMLVAADAVAVLLLSRVVVREVRQLLGK